MLVVRSERVLLPSRPRCAQRYVENQVLSVIQGEVAAAQPGDGPRALGSDSATTCHIVGFRNPASGRTCLAHLDSADRLSEVIGRMLALVTDPTQGHGDAGFAPQRGAAAQGGEKFGPCEPAVACSLWPWEGLEGGALCAYGTAALRRRHVYAGVRHVVLPFCDV